MSLIDYSGEGRSDAVVARRLILAAGGVPGRDYVAGRRDHGKHALDQTLPGLMAAACYGSRVLMLRDLDAEKPCAGHLAQRLAPEPPPGFCLRIAVRASEAWLLADREGIARAMRVRVRHIPAQPETLADPKRELRQLGACSRDPEVRRLLGGTAQQATAWVIGFAEQGWDPARASLNASSLARALDRLRALAGN